MDTPAALDTNESVPTLMHILVAAVAGRAAAEFRPHGLNVQGARVMRVLLNHPGIRPGALSERTAVDNSTLSHMLRRLEQAGLLVRERAADDERSVSLHLTRQGRTVAGFCQESSRRHEANLLRPLSAEEAAQLRRLLLRLKAGIMEEEPNPAAVPEPGKRPRARSAGGGR